MNPEALWIKRTGMILCLLTLLTACSSANRSSPALEVVSGQPKNPVVEAWIEYPGPPSRWAGPSSLLIHIDVHPNGDTAKITWTSEAQLFSDAGKPIPRETVQDALDDLSEALHASAIPLPETCVNPVRVRLIRSDQSVQERRGCRSPIGWPRIASEVVSDLLTARMGE